MFHVKICGVTQCSDIDAVSASGGDAVGLNFFPPSVRYLDPDSGQAKELSVAAERAGLKRIGVFVNQQLAEIQRIADRLGLDAIQLHGDESIEAVEAWTAVADWPWIRAIKLPTSPLDPDEIDRLARPWIEAGFTVLLDADAGRDHGGSGKILDWASIGRWSQLHPEVDWILAGGLTPENVAQAIEVSGSSVVDTASGVERQRGRKSAALISQFVQNARDALGR